MEVLRTGILEKRSEPEGFSEMLILKMEGSLQESSSRYLRIAKLHQGTNDDDLCGQ